MDEHIQSFLELTAKDDLVQLVADKRAAWLWSSDGARILWANAAGAAFFSAGTVKDLAGLASLERSPARPHIARIAETGLADRFSIDRLRFYRGLRVMLLTCQCKRVELENGETAALIICGDNGIATTKDPVAAFSHLLGSDSSTVFVMSEGQVRETIGTLHGVPEDLELPHGQPILSGALDLAGSYHDGIVVQVPAGPKVVVLSNEPMGDELGETGEEDAPAPVSVTPLPQAEVEEDAVVQDAATTGADADAADEAAQEAPEPATDDDGSEWVRADDVYLEEDFEEPAVTPALSEVAGASSVHALDADEEELPEAGTEAGNVPDADARADDVSDRAAAEAGDPLEETAADDAGYAHEPAVPQDSAENGGFVFKPRRRPIRFAWKMDIDQRFTFLSDEFSDVLGPEAADIVGSTWEEVSGRFGLDPRGLIARALDRRDTWSGKTVDWPVTGAALRVPVDMAALPAFDRNRKFEGYRGFGVCRTADALQDAEGHVVFAADGDLADTASQESEDLTEMAAPAEPVDVPLVDGPADDTGELAPGSPPAGGSDDIEEASDQVSEEASGDDMSEPSEADTEADTEAAADEDIFEAESSAALPDDVEEDAPAAEAAAAPQARLEDLKPLQPESLKGKTFLGTSAAALVGSLAKFSGKNASGAKTSSGETTDFGEDLTAELRAAAAALNEAPDEAPSDTGAPAEDAETAEGTAEADDFIEEVSETPDHAEAPDDLPEDLASQSDADILFAADEDASSRGSDEIDTKAEETSEPVPAREEPSGISGPAPLKPDEIESAVKTLAKTYKKPVKADPDLFEGTEAANDESRSLTASAIPEEPDLADEVAEESDTPDESGFASDAFIEDDFDIDEAGMSDETVAVRAESDNDDLEADPDEKEFFEETVAHHMEDQVAGEDEPSPEADPAPERTGKVIPLATARPRVVPVDTSSLSRPEREAFRKIAEALGARLEGDLDDFDAPDQSEPEPEDPTPVVPAPDPIDPSLLDRLPIGIAIVHDREVLYSNKALLNMLGYKSTGALSEAGGAEALFIDDAEDLPDAARMDGEVDEPMKMRHADGGIVCVDAHMHAVPWNGSRGLMISVTERPARPATASEPAEQASPNFFAEVRSELESARNRIAEMDTILETATDGVLVLDEHGSIVKVNGSAEALFSANRSDMIGAPFTEFLAPESHRAAADYLDGLSRNGVASILNDGREVLGKVPTGGLIPLFMTMGRITSTKDDAKYCAVLRDITQWKTAEEELTQAKRQAENASSQKSDFLAKISHEIRTPLNAIIGFSEVMMEERFGPIGNERYKDYLKDIRTSGSHIMSLINDLLDLSKIEAGKLDLKFTAVSTNDVINECVALMQPQANRERIIIRASLPESVPDVVADPRSLRQIVLNLLSNAIKYNKSGGQVILSTALENNGEVVLRVRDTGTGMTAKQLAAALEPFRQLHTTSRGGGTGLGLPLTKALVEANRASFHIDSTPDQGTLVEIVFPTQRVLSE